MTANIAICAKVAKTALYPACAHASVARLQIAAADRLRQHAAGPWTGGDGPDASQPLRTLPLAVAPLAECAVDVQLQRHEHEVEREPTTSPRRARSASRKGTTLAAVHRVDRRGRPAAQPPSARSLGMCSGSVDCPRLETRCM